jgi:hypothetical protein
MLVQVVRSTHSQSGGTMESRPEKNAVRITLTPVQREQIRVTIGRDAEAIELIVEELEQRITPGMFSNHNETLLVEAS